MRRKTRRTRKTRRRKTKRRRTPARSRRCELFRGDDTVASVGTPYTQSAANLQWEKKDFALNQINLSGGIIFSVGIEAAASVDGYERGQMRAYMELMAATEDKNLDPKARKFMQDALQQHSADAKSGKGGLSSYFVAGAYVTAAAVLAAAGYMAYSAGIFGKIGGWISSFTSSAKNAAMPFAKQYMHDKMGVPKEQINQVLGAGDESGGAWYNPFSWWRQQATRPGHMKTKNAVRKAGAVAGFVPGAYGGFLTGTAVCAGLGPLAPLCGVAGGVAGGAAGAFGTAAVWGEGTELTREWAVENAYNNPPPRNVPEGSSMTQSEYTGYMETLLTVAAGAVAARAWMNQPV